MKVLLRVPGTGKVLGTINTNSYSCGVFLSKNVSHLCSDPRLYERPEVCSVKLRKQGRSSSGQRALQPEEGVCGEGGGQQGRGGRSRRSGDE